MPDIDLPRPGSVLKASQVWRVIATCAFKAWAASKGVGLQSLAPWRQESCVWPWFVEIQHRRSVRAHIAGALAPLSVQVLRPKLLAMGST